MSTLLDELADDAAGYGRSFLIVVGCFFVFALLIGFARQGWEFLEHTSVFGVCMLVLVLALAVIAFVVAISAPDSLIGQAADAASRHEISILLIIVAWPVHMLLKPIWNRKRGGEHHPGA